MITKFKIYEGVWSKNIKIGDIYKIESMLLGDKDYRSNIPLGRVIKSYHDNLLLELKTFIKGSYENYIMYCISPKNLKRKATKEEIQEFEAIENSKKYNL